VRPKKADVVSESTIGLFQNDGVALLKDVFEPWVEGVREAIEQNKVKPSWRERTYRPDDGSEALFFQDYCVWSKFPGYRSLVEESPMAEIAARLMRRKLRPNTVILKEKGLAAIVWTIGSLPPTRLDFILFDRLTNPFNPWFEDIFQERNAVVLK
jgi:hypothetical protein